MIAVATAAKNNVKENYIFIKPFIGLLTSAFRIDSRNFPDNSSAASFRHLFGLTVGL